MDIPKLRIPNSGRQMVDTFRGYNHNLRIGDGEFYDMMNLTSDHYPVMASRCKRGIYATPARCTGMIAKDALCYVDGGSFVINGKDVPMNLNDEEKQLIGMGAYVIILPDRKYINTEDLTDWGEIDASVTTQSPVTFSLCKQDGSAYVPNYIGAAAPEKPENMFLWLDTSQTKASLKQWSQSAGMWVSIATTYIQIKCPGIGKAFKQFDGISVSGLSEASRTNAETGEITPLIDADTGEEVHSAELEALDGSFVAEQVADDYIVVTGLLSDTIKISNSIKIERKMPQMDFVVEAQNRLWGCYYGLSEDKTRVINEIYCSKLGDFKNWNCFQGISTDSWVGSVGTDGCFTGAITHLGYPLFFKENVLHKVHISSTGAHQIVDRACRGVQEGSHKSLAIVGETLFYKSLRGVCAYDGSLPSEVSQALGSEIYCNAVAGAYGSKYYICMENAAGVHHLFVLNTDKGMWHKEDVTDIRCFCTCRGELYFLDGVDGRIKTVSGAGEKDTEPVRWMAQSGIIGLSDPDMKYISKISLRINLPMGSQMCCYAQYDSSGRWEHLFTINGCGTRSFTLPVRLTRCDHLRLKLEGTGEFRLFSRTDTIEQGSDAS